MTLLKKSIKRFHKNRFYTVYVTVCLEFKKYIFILCRDITMSPFLTGNIKLVLYEHGETKLTPKLRL